jgi:hypothetical protein
MTARDLATGTVVGALTLSATGTVTFWTVLGNFYAYALSAGSATGVPRESPLIWAVALGALSYSTLVTLAIGNCAGSPTIGAGIKVGAVIGFLVWFAADFFLYGISNVLDLKSAIIDPLLEVVPSAVAGGAIAAVLGKAQVAR